MLFILLLIADVACVAFWRGLRLVAKDGAGVNAFRNAFAQVHAISTPTRAGHGSGSPDTDRDRR